ncbi:Cilia- and flagella-associated protein 65 [Phytophthora ramorum]|uniref:Cilia- and flagella-associated protein 65 n=1 Tax=Phytophthora ramorum TaxID=164328 RepID=UPI0030A88936|nr:Cilia- and flagella-associated protein 65 [Phytophthora ramorum]
MEQTEARPVLDRVEQRRRYGLDCGNPIRFEAGAWAPGGEHARQLTVRNVSQRTIKFKYELPRTKYFSMNFPTVMTLSPGMLTMLDVAFRPVKLEEYDDFVGFHVHVIEGGVAAVSGRFRVPVVARIAALKVEIPHGVDFGFCPTKETTLQSFTLYNCGQIDALFDWTVPAAGEHGSPFAVRPESGRVKAGASIELTASFFPTSASVYVTTTACSVKPDTKESFAPAQALVETMKISGISKFTHLSASERELNFGEVLVGAPNTSRAPTEKEFILRNRSLVRASFCIENVESDHDPRFFFSPLTGVVEAESTVVIKVRYTPLSAGTFTSDHFDILTPGGNRSNRTFRLVNVDTFTPPWCMVAKTCGNTFASPTEQFLPKISFRLMKNKVQFPPCYLGDSVFQTIMIENASDTPALFTFVEDPAEVFSCKPTCGYVEAKSFHLVAIRFTPRNVRKYSHFLQCVVNNARAKPEVLELTAICALPQLSFQDIEAGQLLPSEAKVYVKPTAVGLESLRQIELINTSRVPLVYRWELPPKYQRVFRVKPKLGRLNGRETASIECSFTPSEIREYAGRFLVAVKSISIPLDQGKSMKAKIPVLQELTVRVQTKGTTGAILFQPETLKFETILVNSSSKQAFFIQNTADCDLMYSLQQSMVSKTRRVRQNGENDVDTDEDEVDATTPVGNLVFSQAEGRIPAQSRKKITATFLPTSAGIFTFEVSCVVGDQTNSSPYDTWGFHELKQPTCIIQAEASFPTIEIEDLRVPGVATQLAWHQFQCNKVNEYLAAPLTKEEEKTGRSTATTAGNNDSGSPESGDLDDEFSLKRFAIPFSPAPLGSRTERVFLKLRNPGSLVVQYYLRYPKEGNVEIEHWAETSAPSPEELRLNAIIDSKVFGISPRRATLLPQQSILLTLSYSYTSEAYDGEHDLPLYLEVDKGKKVVLELQGRTLAHKDPKLFLPTQVFHLSPVTIGEFRQDFQPPRALARRTASSEENDDYERSEYPAHLRTGRPPVQQVEVFNRGDSALRLEVGSVSFKQVNAANYGYRVLRCVNSSEIIPAKSSIFLDIEFNPIKLGTIEVPLLLKAHGLMGKGYKEMVEITIVATGYHPKQWTLQQMKDELWALTSPPKKQALSIPDLPACFVSDCIDFGHVSMHSEANHLLVLQNVSSPSSSGRSDIAPRSFIFEWDTMHPLVANGTIVLSPRRGELGPGEKTLIRVSVHTGGDAFVVNHDVACLVTYSNEDKDGKSNNAATTSPTRSKVRSSGTSSSKTRTSVINRSIATQEAVPDKRISSVSKLVAPGSSDAPETQSAQRSSHGSSRKTLLKSTRRGSPEMSGVVSSSDSRHLDTFAEQSSTPLFVRIYAHVLPVDVMERIYPRGELKKLPLQSTKQIPRVLPVSSPTVRDVKAPSLPTTRDTSTPTRTGRGIASLTTLSASKDRIGSGKLSASKPGTGSRDSVMENESTAAKCRDVLYDVMETLVMDVLTSSAIQEAFQEQLEPLPRSDRAIHHAENSEAAKAVQPREALCYKARQNDDCQAIISGVMENTVFNVLQELFYGDLEQELLCVPRKTVFPNVLAGSSPAASHQPIIDTTLLKT